MGFVSPCIQGKNYYFPIRLNFEFSMEKEISKMMSFVSDRRV
jgi:hypothetical protein